MSFNKKTWKNRITEHPERRYLAPTSTENEYDVIRREGEVIQEGDFLDANTLNDLEERIYEGVQDAEELAGNIKIRGHVDSVSELPSTGQEGWCYSVGNDNYLYVWDLATSTWKNIGQIQGVSLPLSVVDGMLCVTFEEEEN